MKGTPGDTVELTFKIGMQYQDHYNFSSALIPRCL